MAMYCSVVIASLHVKCVQIRRLREVLLAFTLHNPDIGYCQGFNFIAAVFLLLLKTEDAFWFVSSVYVFALFSSLEKVTSVFLFAVRLKIIFGRFS